MLELWVSLQEKHRSGNIKKKEEIDNNSTIAS